MASAAEPRRTRSGRNRDFAKRALRFVDRGRAAPGGVPLAAGCAAAAVLAVVVGAFGTGAMPLGVRAGFWATLMG